MKPKVIAEKCTGCGNCVNICPQKIIKLVDRKAVVTEPDKCDQMWACIRICPTGAFTKEDD